MNEPSIRCGALTGNGKRCRRFPIRGGTRCTLHGGGSPQARRVAEEMLAIARVPAARALLQVIEDWSADTCDVCGRPHGDPSPVIRAATAVLDRTGFHPSMALEVSRAEPRAPSWARWLTNDQLMQLRSWIEAARRRMASGAAPSAGLMVEPEESDTAEMVLPPSGLRRARPVVALAR